MDQKILSKFYKIITKFCDGFLQKITKCVSKTGTKFYQVAQVAWFGSADEASPSTSSWRTSKFRHERPSNSWTAIISFKNFSYKILVMGANFVKFCKFWSISTSKFWKRSCHVCDLMLGQILENFEFRILSKSPSYDKPPWRNFDFFCQIFDFGENR